MKPRNTLPGLDVGALPKARKADPPQHTGPQLATLAKLPSDDANWLHEIKFDGYRLMAVLLDGTVRLFTRQGKDWTQKFAAIARALNELPVRQAVLDGEAVVLDDRGISDFQALQNSLDGEDAQLPVYSVFDLLYCEGYDLADVPLLQRKELLKKLCDTLDKNNSVIRYSDHIIGKGKLFYEEACANGLEGVIGKRIDSPYVQRRSTNWIKVKCSLRQEFIICGYTLPSGSRTAFGALLLGYYADGRLIYCGRVGTGFSERLLVRLLEKLEARIQDEPPFPVPPKGAEAKGIQHWVRPELVAEVEFTGWTEDGLLRHPSFKGLRPDKDPLDVHREEPHRDSLEAPNTTQAAPAGKLSNPDKVIYPEQGLTKRELAEYYAAVADWMLPHIVNRPLMLLRCPHGQQRECFFQNHVTEALPPSIHAISIKEGGEVHGYIALTGLDGLFSLVQLGVLEIHPWASPQRDVEKPDRIIFDLDPGPGVAWAEVIDAALMLRTRLNALGLQSFVKTSGGKGLHIYAPIRQRASWDEAKAFARTVANGLAGQNPGRFIAIASKAKRQGKIFVDYLRTGRGSTCIAAYSTRARPRAPVSTPLSWEELPECEGPGQYTMENIPKRLTRLKADPWAGFFDLRQTLAPDWTRA